MEKPRQISVTTLNNGYSLTFEGGEKDGYMYFTIEDLIKGLQFHLKNDIKEHIDINMAAEKLMQNELKRREKEEDDNLLHLKENDLKFPCQTRITFRSEVYVADKDLKSVKAKFERFNLFNKEAVLRHDTQFIEVVSVEDARTNKDIINKYNNE